MVWAIVLHSRRLNWTRRPKVAEEVRALPHTIGARRQLNLLDSYLSTLEAAIERGECELQDSLAIRLGLDVPGIRPGMTVIEALDAVFAAQGPFMSAAPSSHPRVLSRTDEAHVARLLPALEMAASRDDEDRAMCESEARALTVRIKEGCINLCLLLLEAHDGRAWIALGYRTWEGYVRSEFALSRSRAYELLDQARVRRALFTAIGNEDVPPVSARVAAAVRPVLGDVVTTIRRRVAEGGDARAVVSSVLREAHSNSRSRTQLRELGSGTTRTEEPSTSRDGLAEASSIRSIELGNLLRAIEYLTSPSLTETLASLSQPELQRLEQLPIAAQHLNAAASLWLELTGRDVQGPRPVPAAAPYDVIERAKSNFGGPFVRHAGHMDRNSAGKDRDRASASLATIC
jgi:hypothetical protein